ncbi:P1 family peptidase [Streptomyces roseicoloratus]|uniref:P1 family peptidase n=1 Tax=Streptomyces roseicoloratus TaxID=2508722 RepID=A0ABY9S0E7_9ACTN|nr:P1 family peptidase [Streptomyces roseicoloratus]WMX46575.1 P1 family peptidase [Streptomyces roseicoloratus]
MAEHQHDTPRDTSNLTPHDTSLATPPDASYRPPRTTGTHGGITDVAGIRVGHARVAGPRALSGTTVVLAPEGGAVAAVDVRGGGPGTRETDALDPRNLVQRVEAVVLTGGSAYGLDSAGGVMSWLEEQGRGVRVGPDPAHVVPVVPAACVFDLGRGGDFSARPDATTGRAAVEAAAASGLHARVETGAVGAGTGAVVGGLKGGVGTASTVLESGITVGALVVVNAVGSAVDPETGVPYGGYFSGFDGLDDRGGSGDVHGPVRFAFPDPAVHAAAMRRLAEAQAKLAPPPLNTTLAVVATDAVLTRAQAHKLAGTAHDGIARAVRPVHLLNDGDTVFALATGARELPSAPGPLALNEILAAGADTITQAIVQAVLAPANGVSGPGGDFPSYRELYGDTRNG